MTIADQIRHGGKRTGAGRPKAPETKIISFRVPVAKIGEIQNLVKSKLIEYKAE